MAVHTLPRADRRLEWLPACRSVVGRSRLRYSAIGSGLPREACVSQTRSHSSPCRSLTIVHSAGRTRDTRSGGARRVYAESIRLWISQAPGCELAGRYCTAEYRVGRRTDRATGRLLSANVVRGGGAPL